MAEKATGSKSSSAGKGQATPTRKEREAANRRPLVGERTKEARKAAKVQLAEERRIAREGMLRGEEKYLPIRDRGPQKKLVRDIVDSRFTLGEILLPMMFIFLIFSTASTSTDYTNVLIFSMWFIILLIVLDAWLVGRKALKAVEAKFGASQAERGIKWYAAMRSMQMRPMRMPKPQVKRGKRK